MLPHLRQEGIISTEAGLKEKSLVVLRLLLIYGALLLLAYIFQDRLLYLPRRIAKGQIEREAELVGLRFWQQDGEEYLGFTPIKPPSPLRGTVIVFHGNAGAAADRYYYVQPLERLGFRVILAEYPGYGGRSGRPTEAALVANGLKSARTALREFGRPVFIWGESLGCGVASAVAADSGLKVDGIILLTPWDNLPRTAQAHYWFLFARWLVRDRYDNVRNLQYYRGTVAVLMAEQDEVIPNRLTRKLFQEIACTKRLWVFPNAGHNSWPISPQLPWWSEVMDFVAGGNDAESAIP